MCVDTTMGVFQQSSPWRGFLDVVYLSVVRPGDMAQAIRSRWANRWRVKRLPTCAKDVEFRCCSACQHLSRCAQGDPPVLIPVWAAELPCVWRMPRCVLVSLSVTCCSALGVACVLGSANCPNIGSQRGAGTRLKLHVSLVRLWCAGAGSGSRGVLSLHCHSARLEALTLVSVLEPLSIERLQNHREGGFGGPLASASHGGECCAQWHKAWVAHACLPLACASVFERVVSATLWVCAVLCRCGHAPYRGGQGYPAMQRIAPANGIAAGSAVVVCGSRRALGRRYPVESCCRSTLRAAPLVTAGRWSWRRRGGRGPTNSRIDIVCHVLVAPD